MPITSRWLTARFVCGLMSDLVICKYRKKSVKYVNTANELLLRPGVSKQHSTNVSYEVIVTLSVDDRKLSKVSSISVTTSTQDISTVACLSISVQSFILLDTSSAIIKAFLKERDV